MGIYINLNISRSVTREEWKKVYEESLKLVEAFPLADIDKIGYAGEEVTCIVPTMEQESVSVFGKPRTGWAATGDYETMKMAEEYFFPKDLVDEAKIDAEAGDAMMEELSSFASLEYDDPKASRVYSLWNSKTQGEPYHMYLLAIACMVEDRLGTKAYVRGDITRGQCRKAVEMANYYLDNPIRIPARCDMYRLYERISMLPLSGEEKLDAFRKVYLGKTDEEFGEFIRNHFSADIICNFWRNRFKNYSIQMVGFRDEIKEYLSMGFEIADLCTLSSLQDNDGIPRHEKFVKIIMDSKLHQKEKNCYDYLEIDQESEQTYGIWTLMVGFAFQSAKNHKVDRYIPIEEIRASLKNGLGEKCDVDAVVDEYLEKEKATEKISISDQKEISNEKLQELCEIDASEVFTQLMERKYGKYMEEKEKYKISDLDDLLSYQKGDSIHPGLQRNLAGVYRFYQKILEEKWYYELMEKKPESRCAFLMKHNENILIRDKDWRHIFSEIEKTPEGFARYYPMVRVDVSDSQMNHIVRAFTLNDDLFSYAEELSREITDEEERTQGDE